MGKSIDVFNVHNTIMDEYSQYIESFLNIEDPHIRQQVLEGIRGKRFWPEPMVQFNPAYEVHGSVAGLCNEGLMHDSMKNIFHGFELYRHQEEAIRLGVSGKDFIVTSGTGSGKSLTYLGAIFDHLLKNPAAKGVQAVIVYPMNALINSQHGEIVKYKEKYEELTKEPFPIRFSQYTGQEDLEQKGAVKESLPQILLTNYMMLELILTRVSDMELRRSIFTNMKFLVFDELHTYRGRQGADVAMLIRRLKADCMSEKIICIGTSATMVAGKTVPEHRQAVADVAAKIFGAPFSANQIVMESLTRSLSVKELDAATLRRSVETGIDVDAAEEVLRECPLAIWLEQRIALAEEAGVLLRGRPFSLGEMSQRLAESTGLETAACRLALLHLFQWISNVNTALEEKNAADGGRRKSLLPFKLHQFISQTGAIYLSLRNGEERYVSLTPEDHLGRGEEKLPLFPAVFSRASGHTYICVTLQPAVHKLAAREFSDFMSDDDNEDEESSPDNIGYIIPDLSVWNPQTDIEKLPDAWLKKDKQKQPVLGPNGVPQLDKQYEGRIPRKIWYTPEGLYSFEGPLELCGWYMPVKLLFDPAGGMFFDTRTAERTKLAALGNEGRSTSTTILVFAVLKQLAAAGYPASDQKLLSFTDNRQDAALQSGHFNDYFDLIRLRSAIYQALPEASTLDHGLIAGRVFGVLGLKDTEYAKEPSTFPAGLKQNEEALRLLLMYRIIYDLRYSWRVTLPNLEQCGLLRIQYANLHENAAYDTAWQELPLVAKMDHVSRAAFLHNILEYFRKSFAIESREYLEHEALQKNKSTILEKLNPLWQLDDSIKLEPNYLFYETLPQKFQRFSESAGPQSRLGRYVRQLGSDAGEPMDSEGYRAFIGVLFRKMKESGWLTGEEVSSKEGHKTWIYRLQLNQVLWIRDASERLPADPVHNRGYKDSSRTVNQYFRNMYLQDYRKVKSFKGNEHTGQISNDDRQKREEDFRSGEISALFCSPTMELGIDIKDLNVVHMRNVPPNPANYAQRSGRSGRSGQAALVFTTCSSYSPHDRNYFKNATEMVAGSVRPPVLDMTNEELIRTHLHSFLLSRRSIRMNNSILDIVENDNAHFPLLDTVRKELTHSEEECLRATDAFMKVISDLDAAGVLKRACWYNRAWVETVIRNLPKSFDDALGRWRTLYNQMQMQLEEAQFVIRGGQFKKQSREMYDAINSEFQAMAQRELLKNSQMWLGASEFYPYRYFAAEGVLPGYNFSRLPVRVYIPKGRDGEYMSRPRFIALREFGPQNLIYRNGKRYRIEKMPVSEAEKALVTGKVCTTCGYFLEGSDYTRSVCPFDGTALDQSGNCELYTDLLPLSDVESREQDRISCEEEIRLSKGYTIETWFSTPDAHARSLRALIRHGDKDLLSLRYLQSARIVMVNRKWSFTQDGHEGFRYGLRSGCWKKQLTGKVAVVPAAENAEPDRQVKLFTSDTADALYIEPMQALDLSEEGIITFLYAVKRAIEQFFQVESSELAGLVIGGTPSQPNIMLYESSEGSLGVLSRIVEDAEIFHGIIAEAWRVCRYDDAAYLEEASYDDLLSYYNQSHHYKINRFLIKEALALLQGCSVELQDKDGPADYEEQYRNLKEQVDPNASTETVFLEYLYKNGLKLPDAAQYRVKDVYCQADFYYKGEDVIIYCDGSVHDTPEQQQRDREQRDALRRTGHNYEVYYYKDGPQKLVESRPDIFRKVKQDGIQDR